MLDLQPFQQRVVDERTALNIKIAALVAFSTTKMWEQIDEDEQFLLISQLNAMQQYTKCLDMRIAKFSQ